MESNNFHKLMENKPYLDWNTFRKISPKMLKTLMLALDDEEYIQETIREYYMCVKNKDKFEGNFTPMDCFYMKQYLKIVVHG